MRVETVSEYKSPFGTSQPSFDVLYTDTHAGNFMMYWYERWRKYLNKNGNLFCQAELYAINGSLLL